MRIELNGYSVSQLNDGRYHVINSVECVEFIADNLDDALQVINA